jgi:hypothetical protein
MIILSGGIATRLEGAVMPIYCLLDSNAIGDALENGIEAFDKLATFEFIMGPPEGVHKHYPHENLKINPDMEQYFCPLPTPCFSVLMRCHLQDSDAVMETVRLCLKTHNMLGGLYTVGNDKVYSGCVLLDLSGSGTEFRFNFFQPTITLLQAVEAYNEVMSGLIEKAKAAT